MRHDCWLFCNQAEYLSVFTESVLSAHSSESFFNQPPKNPVFKQCDISKISLLAPKLHKETIRLGADQDNHSLGQASKKADPWDFIDSDGPVHGRTPKRGTSTLLVSHDAKMMQNDAKRISKWCSLTQGRAIPTQLGCLMDLRHDMPAHSKPAQPAFRAWAEQLSKGRDAQQT